MATGLTFAWGLVRVEGRLLIGAPVQLPGFNDASAILQPGVYALVHLGRVVYIGKAKAMIVRVATHRSNARRDLPAWLPPSAKGIVFDEIHIQPCHPDVIDDLEYAMINLYKPKFNTQLKHAATSKATFTLSIRGHDVTFNPPRPKAEPFERRV